ncbi:rhomboid family intramembrane serine protease [Roseibaca sp. Y0-43]|uniref:rhomboid family intramembrane serine protease n=1 Tax=Roseibaca sp. Y0-43 TaxID=2816854 RepID=UPI001D0C12EA|nr:rhomboid family intramembrane serine protease [Roseibaca sp. Y0-43]MCC1481727.1 rhomboid family intramembrane serine protease [Roseibaca sp. Y0-43]
MRDESHPSPIVNPLPWAVWLLTLGVAGVELVLWAGAHGLVNWAGSAGWRAQALVAFGVNAELQGWMWESGRYPAEGLWRYLVYGFVHLGPMQAALVVVITAALGKACAERLGSLKVLVLLLLAQAAGGVAFGLVANPGAWLIGGYPMIFALAGAYAVLMGTRAALFMAGVLVFTRLALVFMGGGGLDWLADLTAMAVGAALARVLDGPLLARLRRR